MSSTGLGYPSRRGDVDRYDHLREDSADFRPYNSPLPHETYDQGAYESEYRDEPDVPMSQSHEPLQRSKEAIVTEPKTFSTCVNCPFFIPRYFFIYIYVLRGLLPYGSPFQPQRHQKLACRQTGQPLESSASPLLAPGHPRQDLMACFLTGKPPKMHVQVLVLLLLHRRLPPPQHYNVAGPSMLRLSSLQGFAHWPL